MGQCTLHQPIKRTTEHHTSIIQLSPNPSIHITYTNFSSPSALPSHPNPLNHSRITRILLLQIMTPPTSSPIPGLKPLPLHLGISKLHRIRRPEPLAEAVGLHGKGGRHGAAELHVGGLARCAFAGGLAEDFEVGAGGTFVGDGGEGEEGGEEHVIDGVGVVGEWGCYCEWSWVGLEWRGG